VHLFRSCLSNSTQFTGDRMRPHIDVALLAAMPLEITGLTTGLAPAGDGAVGGERFIIGTMRAHTMLVGTLGFGKINAAATVAALAERFVLGQVWHLGCAGAYVGGPLAIGDVLISTQCLCGDEGILETEGGRPQSAIGIPLVTAAGMPYYDALPVDETLLAWSRSIVPAGRDINSGVSLSDTTSLQEVFRVVYGRSLTVSLISGDPNVAAQRFLRHQALAEGMEGSSVAQVCQRFGIPMLECRGISNLAGDRDKEHWRLDLAIHHCHTVVRRLMRARVDSP
jgi:futalosine hydrolase